MGVAGWIFLMLPVLDIGAGRVDSATGLIVFDAPGEVGWEQLAREQLGEDVGQPSAARSFDLSIHQDGAGGTSVRFSAALPESYASQFFYWITNKGVERIDPVALQGAIRYAFPPRPSTTISHIRYFGSVTAPMPPGNRGADGGFVLSSAEPLQFEVKAVNLRDLVASDALTVRYDDAGTASTTVVSQTSASGKIVFAQRIRMSAGQEYLFLQWEPDESACLGAFTLLEQFPGGWKEAKSSVYGCDL